MPQEAPINCGTATAEAASEFEATAVAGLRESNARITVPRLAVIRTLAGSQRALSAYQIHERIVSGGGKIDVVSVYRILETLSNLHLIHRIGVLDGYIPCRLGHHTHSVEHLVCRNCGCVSEVEIGEQTACSLRDLAATTGFEPAEIRIEVLGICAHCT